MKRFFVLVGVAAFAVGTPAVAQHGNGHGKQDKAQSSKWDGKAHAKSPRDHVVTTRNGSPLYAFNARGN